MSKWKVWRYPWSGRWEVLDPNGNLEYPIHKTHAEAMAHADRMARTVEVVLPRVHALPTGRHTMHRSGLVIEFKQSSSWTQLKPGYITVEPGERRPLALALLALAEKENDKENSK